MRSVPDGLRQLGRTVKREIGIYRAIAAHPRTPRRARWLLLAAVGYAVLPFDLIPDFIPVLGHLDDAVIIPGLVWLAMKSVPPDVIAECRAAASPDAG